MTTQKCFKRVVRARMAKTGERYAAARRSLIDADTDTPPSASTVETAAGRRTYQLRGGLHPETATLANVLANQGVVSGLTGEPLTEATILGIGGGLGAGYILWEFKGHGAPILTLGFRNKWQYPWIPGWTGKTLERLEYRGRASTRPAARRAHARRSMRWLDARVAGDRVGRSRADRDVGTARCAVGPFRAHRGDLRPRGGRNVPRRRSRQRAVPDRAGRHGRGTRPDRVVQASDRSARDDRRPDSRRIGFARRCRPASRNRSTTCARNPIRSHSPPGANGRG